MRILIYILGTIVVVGAMAYAGVILLGISTVWVVLACLVVLGLGIMGAASSTPSQRTVTTTTQSAPVPPAAGTQVQVTKQE